jgi:serine/threonine protein kinase
MVFSFKGHSGFKISLISDHIVRKASTTEDGSARLAKQAEKQKNFKNTSDFITPRVLQEGYENEFYYFDMELMNFTDFISYFQTSNKNKIDYVAKKIISFIESNIINSYIKPINVSLINGKLEEIKKNVSELDYDAINMILEKQEIVIPTGISHGDFTFSNILFDAENREICLIDFLDDYIETPLNDIVKIRQDTKFKWSLLLYNKNFDLVKMNTILRYIDNKIDSHFSQYEFYRKFYPLFELVNLLRVVRYAKDPNIKEFLLTHINNCINEINCSGSR